MPNKPPPKTGLTRIISAFHYSVNGLRAAISNEAAFRQEVILYAIMLPILFLIPATSIFKALLFSINTLVLIVEILNSAIEAVVDLVSPEYHDLAKRAKDMGSAAVFLSLALAAILWTGVVFSLFN